MSIDGASTALRAPAATRRTRSRAAEIARAIAWPAGAALAFAVLVAVTWGTWGDLAHDTGYDFVAAQRMADGQLAYQDFPYIYGPLGLAVLAGAFNYVSVSIDTAIAVGLVMAAAATALTYALARQLTGQAGAALAATLAATAALGTGTSAWSSRTPRWPPWPWWRRLPRSSPRRTTAGPKTGHTSSSPASPRAWCCSTRPEFVAAIAVALGAWLGARVLLADGAARRRALVDMAICGGAALAVAAVAYGLILTKVSLDSLLHENLFPRDQLDAGGNAVLRGSAPMTAGSFAELAGRLLLYAAGAGALLALASFIRRGSRAAMIAAGERSRWP